MTFAATEYEARYLGIIPPRLKKGSYSSLVLPNPLADCFIAGPENNRLVEALDSQAITSLETRSPLLLAGASGTGKTTMAATMAALWINELPSRQITMTSAAEFSRSLTRSIKSDDMQRFRQLHRECDCLLVDNIHELASKPAAQEEFIATLDHLLDHSRAILLTANDIPPLLSGLSRPLLSRLSSGHSVVLMPPASTARHALLQRMAVQSNLEISLETIEQLAGQIREDMTAVQLRGILIRWSHQVRLGNITHTATNTRVMDRIIEVRTPPNASAQEIAKVVSREMRVPMELLVGPTRKSSVVRARGLAMYLIRQLTTDSFDHIGSLFSGRDHTTVMHACKKTEAELPQNMELRRIHDRILKRFQRPS